MKTSPRIEKPNFAYFAGSYQWAQYAKQERDDQAAHDLIVAKENANRKAWQLELKQGLLSESLYEMALLAIPRCESEFVKAIKMALRAKGITTMAACSCGIDKPLAYNALEAATQDAYWRLWFR